MWEKDLPEGRGIQSSPESLISHNGEIIAIITFDTSGLSDTKDGIYVSDIIYVYDGKSGSVILKTPSDEEARNIRVNSVEAVSDGGRYLAVNVTHKRKKSNLLENSTTLFYDLKKNTFWDSQEKYYIYYITDDGITKVGGDATKPRVEIDLKKYLGK